MNLLDYLRDVKRGLSPEQARTCDDLLLGMLSILFSRQVWEDTVQMAVRMARREKPRLEANAAPRLAFQPYLTWS